MLADPHQDISNQRDIGIRNGRVVAVEETIESAEAVKTIKINRRITTPSLIDLHVHGWWGVAHLGI